MKQGWEIVQLGSLCEIQLGKTPHRKTDQFWDKEKESNNVWLSISDMRHGAVMHDSKEYVSDLGAEIFKITPKGTLMLSFKLTLGRVAFAGSDLLTNEAIASLINLDNKIDQRFLFYYFTFFDWDEATKGDEKVKGKTLNKAKLKKLPIIVPPLEEQKQIVAKLDQCFEAIDKARANAAKNLENAKELFQSKLNDIFSQKGEGWVENKLGEITTKIGSGATPRGGQSSYKESGISLIRSLNVYDDGFREKKLAFIDDAQAEKLNNVTIERDDVLLNITGASVARCCIAPNDFLPARVNQHVSIIRLKKDTMSSEFLHYLLTATINKNILLGIGEQGSTRQAITKTQIQNFIVSYPEGDKEQEQSVESINRLKEQTQSLEFKYQQELNSRSEERRVGKECRSRWSPYH